MNRKSLIAALEAYQTPFDEEKEYRKRFLDLLNSVEECFFRKSLEAHITASAWIVDEERKHTLMIFHRKLGRWLQPGGHADGNENLLEVVRNEVREETGIEYTNDMESVFDLDIHSIPEFKSVSQHDHFDVRFLMTVSKDTVFRRNDESTDIRWISFDELSSLYQHDQSILRLITKARLH